MKKTIANGLVRIQAAESRYLTDGENYGKVVDCRLEDAEKWHEITNATYERLTAELEGQNE